eukprot:304107_1
MGCISPYDPLGALGNPITDEPQSSPSTTEDDEFFPAAKDDNILFTATNRRRSSTINDIPRSHSANPSFDKISSSKHSHHRPQSAVFSSAIIPWTSNKSDDEDDELPQHNPIRQKKKSTLHLPRPPPRKSCGIGKSNSDHEDSKEE